MTAISMVRQSTARISHRRGCGGEKPTLSREQIVRTAIEILDAKGRPG